MEDLSFCLFHPLYLFPSFPPLLLHSYLLSSVHSKVFSAVCRVYSREDRRLQERCHHLKGSLSPSVVGVRSDYECPYPRTLSYLNRLELCHSPLEKLYCLQDAMVGGSGGEWVQISCCTSAHNCDLRPVSLL